MQGHDFSLGTAALTALRSGALWWATERLLAVSDLHLGKSDRMARRGGPLLPPYEVAETLARLEADVAAADPAVVVCLGDSFDDLAAADHLPEAAAWRLARLMAGRCWFWVEGNHDPGPIPLGGSHLAELHLPPLTFRHIARPGALAEISGHYHPKARIVGAGQTITRPAFLIDADRAILPAYGTYTGGLLSDRPPLSTLMGESAVAVLCGAHLNVIPARGRGRGQLRASTSA